MMAQREPGIVGIGRRGARGAVMGARRVRRKVVRGRERRSGRGLRLHPYRVAVSFNFGQANKNGYDRDFSTTTGS
jgi:hypothetical protein